MKSESVYKTARKICATVFALGVAECIIFSLCFGFKYDIALGALYGCAFAAANFFFLAYCVEKSVKKGKAAQSFIGATYTLRLLFTGVMVVLAAKASFLNIWSAVLPLVFPRIAIFLNTFLGRGERK